MAARRLLIIMVVLLTISTLAAALVPPPEERSGTSTTTTSTTRPDHIGGGKLVEAEVSAQDVKKNEPIALETGDQLALVVTSRAPGEVSLPTFGLIEFAGPGSPARFDLLVEKAGEYPVRFQGAGEVAKIVAGQS